MQCPHCGLVMSELDQECLRCKRLGRPASPTVTALAVKPAAEALAGPVEEKECPRCGKATGVEIMLCDKCGYEYQPDISRAERYQALIAQEAAVPSVGTLQRSVPPSLALGIIAACLLVIGGAGWGMFGGSLTGSSAENVMSSPIQMSRHHKRHLAPGFEAVTYRVTGTATQARVSYLAADAVPVSLPTPVTLPWAETVQTKTGSHLSLSAAPTGSNGTVQAAIVVGGTVRKQSDTPGPDGLTQTEATL